MTHSNTHGRPLDAIEFDMVAVERDLGEIVDDPEPELTLVRAKEAFMRLLNWIDQGERFQAKAIRLGAVRFLFEELSGGKTQSDIAVQLHCGKAALSQACVQLKKDLKFEPILVRMLNMRGDEAVQKFSELCKSRHQTKQLSSSHSQNGNPAST